MTDDGREIRFDPVAKPGVSNLLTILSVMSGTAIDTLVSEYGGRGYGDLKTDVADAVVAVFEPIRARTLELLDDPAELDRMLTTNADRAAVIANTTLAKVYDRIGFLLRA